MSKDILSVIQTNMSTFSKGQKLIAGFILESYDKAAFMTASRLGKTVNVSESTVVRFAAELGYDGYPAMQKALQEMIRSKLTSIQRIEVSNDRIGNQDILSMVMQSDMDKIHMTLEETNREDFDRAVSAIVDARHIYILGVRSAAALASFLGFYFNLIFDNVTVVHATSTSEVFEQLLRIGPERCHCGRQLPAVFPPDGEGHAVCPRPGGRHHRPHRQRNLPPGPHLHPDPAGQERYGVLRGLPGGSAVADQRADCGHRPQEKRRPLPDL